MRALLDGGADVNTSTPAGQTALMRAAFFGHADVVRLLLDAGADVRVRDASGLTATEWAVRRGFDEAARLLRDHTPPATLPPPAPAAPVQARREAPPEGGEKAAKEPQAPARVRARETLARVAAESRQRVEEALHKQAEEAARRRPEDGPRTVNDRSALRLERTAQGPPAGSARKRCPQCKTIYESEILTYCIRDSARLIAADEPATGAGALSSEAGKRSDARPWLWVLVLLTLAGGLFIGYRINRSAPGDPAPAAPAAAQEETAIVPPGQPVAGGALKGRELSLPVPQYPSKAKGEGIKGQVMVAVVVNDKGDVVSARATSGPRPLRAAAVRAARAAKFSTDTQAGRRVRLSGTITYTFQ